MTDSGKSCNGGLIFGIDRPRMSDGVHTTLLNITLTSDIIGSTITCSNDDGLIQKIIGNYTVVENCADGAGTSTSSTISSGNI